MVTDVCIRAYFYRTAIIFDIQFCSSNICTFMKDYTVVNSFDFNDTLIDDTSGFIDNKIAGSFNLNTRCDSDTLIVKFIACSSDKTSVLQPMPVSEYQCP